MSRPLKDGYCRAAEAATEAVDDTGRATAELFEVVRPFEQALDDLGNLPSASSPKSESALWQPT